MYELLANLTLFTHLIFILFVIFGGMLFYIFSKIIYIHIPSLLWGIYIEFTNSVCPLTYLEKIGFYIKVNYQLILMILSTTIFFQ